jgi:hypothetical protein
MDSEQWIAENARQAEAALAQPEVQEELYGLLGGEPDPNSEREQLMREVSQLRLRWRPGPQ